MYEYITEQKTVGESCDIPDCRPPTDAFLSTASNNSNKMIARSLFSRMKCKETVAKQLTILAIERVQKHSRTFRIRRVCCHSNETCPPTANQPNTAQLGGSLTIPPKLHPNTCSSEGMRRGTDAHTDTQMVVVTIHFAWLCLARNVITKSESQ